MKVKVAINGYGTIGKRVADAVSRQDDMEVIGVTKTKPDFEAKMALKRGIQAILCYSRKFRAFRVSGY